MSAGPSGGTETDLAFGRDAEAVEDALDAGRDDLQRMLGIRSSAVVVASVGRAGDETLPGLAFVLIRRGREALSAGDADGRSRCRFVSVTSSAAARSLPLSETDDAAPPPFAFAGAGSSRSIGSISSSSARESPRCQSRVVRTELAMLPARLLPRAVLSPLTLPCRLRPVTVIPLRMLIRSSSSSAICAIFFDSSE